MIDWRFISRFFKNDIFPQAHFEDNYSVFPSGNLYMLIFTDLLTFVNPISLLYQVFYNIYHKLTPEITNFIFSKFYIIASNFERGN